MINNKNIFFLISMLLICNACRDEAAHKAAVNAAILEKVSRYKQKRINDCIQTCLTEATLKSDSIMVLNADMWQWNDSIQRPPKMDRPARPDFKKTDSVGIKPLFNRNR
jgi:hypothetical protein